MNYIWLPLFAYAFICIHCQSINESTRRGLMNKDKLQGDIAIDYTNFKYKVKSKLNRYWPSGSVPYYVDPVHGEYSLCIMHTHTANEYFYCPQEKNRPVIEHSLRIIESKSCIKFVVYNASDPLHKHHIYFVEKDGCWSYPGRQSWLPRQELSLGKGCVTQFVILHEVMHALGFEHMHCNFDRDKYIKVRWENVQSGFEDAFTILDAEEYEDTVDFDFSSIMMYFATAFSKDGTSHTIESLTGKSLMPLTMLGNLSNNDIYHLNQAYNCPMEGLRLQSTLDTVTW